MTEQQTDAQKRWEEAQKDIERHDKEFEKNHGGSR